MTQMNTHTNQLLDRNPRRWAVAAVALSLSMLGGAITADAAKNRGDRGSSMQEEQSRRSSDMNKLSGTIKKTKNVGIRGQDRENLVVQLDTKRGKKLVDLGDVDNLEDLDIQRGDKITAWGRAVKIGDKEVFMAHRLKASGETIDIEREQMPRDRQRERQMGRERDRTDETSRGQHRRGDFPKAAQGERYGVEDY